MRAVITGGPSVGKTTIIAMLAELGYPVLQEFATQVIKEGEFLPWVEQSFKQKYCADKWKLKKVSLTAMSQPS